jgi:DNA repair protein RecO (recombination protein O)
MIYHTKGIVLRTIKYGETSIIVSIFTELFGIQSYIVNGIRTQGKTSYKASLFQPASILEMEVYHNELKNLQRIKEFKWGCLYSSILSDVIKNSVAVYMVELLQKCLKQPENNTALFQFAEDAFLQLDIADETVTANFPIFFSLQLVPFFGFSIRDNYSKERTILDLQEGIFIPDVPSHTYYIQERDSANISQLLKAMHPVDLTEIKLNKAARREILLALQTFYALHIPEFGLMKTLPVLQEILT